MAGPFTVESLSPHRVLGVDENDELIDPRSGAGKRRMARQHELRPDDPGEPQDRRRPAGAQGGQDRLHLARRPGRATSSAPKAATWKRDGEKRAAIFIGPEFGTVSRARPGRGRPRGRRRGLRRADRLRLQLRRPLHRVQQARPHPGAQGPDERRPAHGRRPEEHRQGQPVRHLRRAGHRHPRRPKTARSA